MVSRWCLLVDYGLSLDEALPMTDLEAILNVVIRRRHRVEDCGEENRFAVDLPGAPFGFPTKEAAIEWLCEQGRLGRRCVQRKSIDT